MGRRAPATQSLTAPFLALLLCLLPAALAAPAAAQVFDSEQARFRVETVVEGLEHPWGLAFLPDGRLLVTERPGRLRLVENGRLSPPIQGLPPIVARGQGGLLDVALDPAYAENGWLYLTFAEAGPGGIGTALARARLHGERLENLEKLFSMAPKSETGFHFGSRIAFDRAGHVYITIGERGEMSRAQRLDDHAGSVIRLNRDGSLPADNPFAGQAGARPEIYSYGHRNPQGLAVNPATGALWLHEHGPRGGDEVNLVKPGANYGWPRVTFGIDYSGATISEETGAPGIEAPLYYWVPSIAPSGMAFYDGDRFPGWRGDLFVGSLKFDLLVRLALDGTRIVGEERLLAGALGRIRDVRQGPDGLLYLLTDAADGGIYRLLPAE